MTEITLEDLLDQAAKGETPSPFGRMDITVLGSPVSVQAKKVIRDSYLNSIKEQFVSLQYILTGDIFMDITWFISAKSRYETDAGADIDNCIKPIIDAFTGPDGLFIDDCQLRGLYISWSHITSDQERLLFELKFHPDEFSNKDELAFVRIDNGLCTPVNLNWSDELRTVWAELLIKGQITKESIENLGVDYMYVAGFLSNSRPFHVTRVKEFRFVSLEQFTVLRSSSVDSII